MKRDFKMTPQKKSWSINKKYKFQKKKEKKLRNCLK